MRLANEWVAVGIDTSNYTTSLCAVDSDGNRLWEGRRLLAVASGERGLMQSAALFAHLGHLPDLLTELQAAVAGRSIRAVGVSAQPRRAKGSYMPVFRAGIVAARAVAAGAGAPILESSHQSGHIAAAISTCDAWAESSEPFIALHLSGGTTDLLWVTPCGHDYEVGQLATGADLHAGQFVDRVGVMLGFSFPCGPALEKLALTHDGQYPDIPSSVRSGSPSFSGPWSAVQRAYAAGARPEAVALSTFRCLAVSVEKMIRFAWERVGAARVLVVGGVAANSILRARLRDRLGPRWRLVYFCDPYYSSDNAFGLARMAWKSVVANPSTV